MAMSYATERGKLHAESRSEYRRQYDGYARLAAAVLHGAFAERDSLRERLNWWQDPRYRPAMEAELARLEQLCEGDSIWRDYLEIKWEAGNV